MPQTTDESSGSAGPALVFFAKVPVPGQVKTRLCPPLTPAEAAGLYRGFLEDVLAPFDGVRTLVYAWPGDALDGIRPLVPDGVELRAQRGEDLWERMTACFDELFAEGHDRIVLRNTDSPDLPGEVVRAAFDATRPGRVVLGPDPGGGYYLIGLAERRPELFGVAVEGGATVFEATRRRVAEIGFELEILPEHADVDTFEDLQRMFARRSQR